jgi:hypothetical protein
VRKKRPILITVIAIVQIVPILLLPPQLLLSVNRLVFLVPVGVFALILWALVTLRPVGRLLTIFIQGFNIIIRLVLVLARVVPSKKAGTPADIPLLVTSLLSIAGSTLILYYVDKTDTQLLFES